VQLPAKPADRRLDAFDFVANGRRLTRTGSGLLGIYKRAERLVATPRYLGEFDCHRAYDLDDVIITRTASPPGGDADEAGPLGDFETVRPRAWAPPISSRGAPVNHPPRKPQWDRTSLLTTGRTGQPTRDRRTTCSTVLEGNRSHVLAGQTGRPCEGARLTCYSVSNPVRRPPQPRRTRPWPVPPASPETARLGPPVRYLHAGLRCGFPDRVLPRRPAARASVLLP